MPKTPSFRSIRPAALLLAIVAAVRGEIVMGTSSSCAMASDALGVEYRNANPDPWDLRGWGVTIGGERVAGPFAMGPGGGTFVAPGAKAAINFAGCGRAGAVRHRQVEAKIGACNEPSAPALPAPVACSAIQPTASFYDPAACARDRVGGEATEIYGGFVDAWAGRTQIQVAASAPFAYQGAQVRIDPASMGGPFWMMSMAAVQEFLQADMQAMLALGAAATGAGLVDAGGTSLYVPPANTGNDTERYGSLGVTALTITGRLYNDYPRYFPGKPALADLVASGTPGPTPKNGPQHVNSGLIAALNLWWYFDGLSAAQDLCFRNFLLDAKDRRAGLKLILNGYHIGPNAVDRNTGATDYANHLLPASPSSLAAADITPYLKRDPWGQGADSASHERLKRLTAILDAVETANAGTTACGGGGAVYDAGISLAQVLELFYGAGGAPAKQGAGGLLWHYALTAPARAALKADLECAFGKLQGKAPGRGPSEISFRYDFLTVLRAARAHFAGLDKFGYKPQPLDPFSSEYSIWVFNHGRTPCAAAPRDPVWPSLTLADTAFRAGDKVEKSASDNLGLRSREFTTDTAWRAWRPASPDFAVPAGLAAGTRLWYRVADSCGNAVIEEVPLASGPVGLAGPPARLSPRPGATAGRGADGRARTGSAPIFRR